MSLLIAVKDVGFDAQLIAAGRALADAAGWETRAVHVREPGQPALPAPEGSEEADLVGDAAAELLEFVALADTDCVAVGLRPGGGLGLGRVAEAFLAAFIVPVLLVRRGMRPLDGLRRLLVPLDGTPSTSAAMRFAEEILCRPGCDIIMLNVATRRTPVEVGSMPAPRFIDEEQYEWLEWQDEFSRRFSPGCDGCHHQVSVVPGEPAKAVMTAAREEHVDLVILTWKGRFEGGHGPVVRRALEESPCPLLIVPEDWVPRGGELRPPASGTAA